MGAGYDMAFNITQSGLANVFASIISLVSLIFAGMASSDAHTSVYSELNMDNTIVLSRRPTPDGKPQLRLSFNGSPRNINGTILVRNGTKRYQDNN